MAKISFKLFFCVGILFIATNSCFAEKTSDLVHSPYELHEEFYKTGLILDTEVLQAINEIQKKLPKIVKSSKEKELFIVYLQYGTVLSSYYIMSEDTFLPILKEFETRVKLILKNSPFSSNVGLAYANYLMSTLAWSPNMATLKTLPILYRRILVIPSASEDQRVELYGKIMKYAPSLKSLIIASIGKNNSYFGEGIRQNFFFPQNFDINPWKMDLWNVSINIPVMPFLLTTGVFFDTKSLDTLKKTIWYSFYVLTEYYHRSFTLSAETDVLFTPDADSKLSSKTALQASVLLPYDIAVYSNAMVQVVPTKKGLDSWGTLIGVSKYTSINDV